MKKIVITYDQFLDGEVDLIKALIKDGLYAVHIRKHESTLEEMEAFVLKFDSFHRAFFVMCSHRSLVDKYGMKGMHFSSYEEVPDERQDWYTYSTSCHTLEELTSNKDKVDYVLLSPIFDSISKPGYVSSWKDRNELTNALMNHDGCEVMALGGVAEDKLKDVKHMCFDGYAMLGSIWMPLLNKANNKNLAIKD